MYKVYMKFSVIHFSYNLQLAVMKFGNEKCDKCDICHGHVRMSVMHCMMGRLYFCLKLINLHKSKICINFFFLRISARLCKKLRSSLLRVAS